MPFSAKLCAEPRGPGDSEEGSVALLVAAAAGWCCGVSPDSRLQSASSSSSASCKRFAGCPAWPRRAAGHAARRVGIFRVCQKFGRAENYDGSCAQLQLLHDGSRLLTLRDEEKAWAKHWTSPIKVTALQTCGRSHGCCCKVVKEHPAVGWGLCKVCTENGPSTSHKEIMRGMT